MTSSDAKLDLAGDYAKEGDREMMELCIGQAEKHNLQTGGDASYVSTRADEIRSMLRDEESFYTKKFHQKLLSATRCAAEGDREMMEIFLKNSNNSQLDGKL